MSATLKLYGTREDHLKVLDAIEKVLSVQYIHATLHSSPIPPVMTSAQEIDSLGFAFTGESACERQFLILPKGAAIQTRSVHLLTGSTRYIVDYHSNPECVVFSGGGLFENRCLIAGFLTLHTSNRMANLFFQTMKKCYQLEFTQIKSALVGANAMALFEKGFRLTTHADPIRNGDLTR